MCFSAHEGIDSGCAGEYSCPDVYPPGCTSVYLLCCHGNSHQRRPLADAADAAAGEGVRVRGWDEPVCGAINIQMRDNNRAINVWRAPLQTRL